mmetsp:Transcript_92406/g.169532  ORF Transcript_92406/g.169532 Transcript_92406/m.169532 type:complete len:97 (-) Transcript_92406:2514-2804(-)
MRQRGRTPLLSAASIFQRSDAALGSMHDQFANEGGVLGIAFRGGGELGRVAIDGGVLGIAFRGELGRVAIEGGVLGIASHGKLGRSYCDCLASELK